MIRNLAAALVAALLLIAGTIAIQEQVRAQGQNPASTQQCSFKYTGSNVTSFATNPTDWIVIAGSTTKKVAITQFSFWGIATNPATIYPSLLRRSTADAGGTSTPVPATTLDTACATATATVNIYTANPATLGTLVGPLHPPMINLGVSGSAGNASFDSGTRDVVSPIVLRGNTQLIAVNLNSTSMPAGASINYAIETFECTGC